MIIKDLFKKVVGSKSREGVYIVKYHHITSDLTHDYQICGKRAVDKIYTDTKVFASHLEFYGQHFKVVSLDEAIERMKKKDVEPALAITFDDGFRSVLKTAHPMLQAKGFPHTVFLSGNPFLRSQGFSRLRLSKLLDLSSGSLLRKFQTLMGSKVQTADELFTVFKDEYRREFDALMEQAWQGMGSGIRKQEREFYLDSESIKGLDKDLVSYGSHTYSHPVLSALTYGEQRFEIEECHREMELALDQKLKYFTYPFGGKAHFNKDSKTVIKDMEKVIAFSAYGGQNKAFDATDVRRFAVCNQSVEEIDNLLRD